MMFHQRIAYGSMSPRLAKFPLTSYFFMRMDSCVDGAWLRGSLGSGVWFWGAKGEPRGSVPFTGVPLPEEPFLLLFVLLLLLLMMVVVTVVLPPTGLGGGYLVEVENYD